MAKLDIEHARSILTNLRETLQKVTAGDPEQEVRGVALVPLDAALSSIRDLVPDSPVISRINDVISPENIQEGEPIRAVDVLIVVDILLGALPRRQRRPGVVFSPDVPQRP